MTEPKKIGFTEEQLEQFADDFRRGEIAQVPKEVLAILGDYYVQLVEKAVYATENVREHGNDISSVSHALCHIYEDGLMSNELCRPIGDVLLDKLIEKAEQGYFSYANRSIDGYWRSVKDNKDAQKGLKAVLEKHPNYVFGQKYLSYINGVAPEDEKAIMQSYLENPNMYFVTTNMVDIDGTLIRNGKANDGLIHSMGYLYGKKKLAIYTGGDPVSQKKVLLKAIAEKILEKFPFVKEEFSVDTIVNIYSQDNEQNTTLREKLYSTIKRKTFDFVLNQGLEFDVLQRVKFWAKDILEFLNLLMAKSGDQIKIYPKQAFTQKNICLAGMVIDDTQPAAQEIKSLSLSVLMPGEYPSWVKHAMKESLSNVPEERKITAEQAFAMYQQKCKENMIAGAKQVDMLSTTEKKATAFSDSCNTNVKKTTR